MFPPLPTVGSKGYHCLICPNMGLDSSLGHLRICDNLHCPQSSWFSSLCCRFSSFLATGTLWLLTQLIYHPNSTQALKSEIPTPSPFNHAVFPVDLDMATVPSWGRNSLWGNLIVETTCKYEQSPLFPGYP